MEAICGIESTRIKLAAVSLGERIVTGVLPARPAIEPRITPGLSGATNNARPVASVVRRSPFEKFTTVPEVKRPLASSTARVARSPEITVRGSTKVRPAEELGGFCADADKKSRRNTVARQQPRTTN